MKNILIVLLCFTISSINAQLHINCGMKEKPHETIQKSMLCNNNFFPFLQNHTDDMIPEGATRHLTIRTNVIFVQDGQGEGNFDLNNPEHVALWDGVFETMNERLLNMEEQSCGCNDMPNTYGSVNIQYEPRYIEIQSDALFDHNQDATASSCPYSPGCNSFNKTYLNDINEMAMNTPNYVDGFNWIVTSDEPDLDMINENIANNGPAIWSWSQHYGGWWYSSYPTTDLEHPAMWHSPDLYLMYVVNDNYNWNGFIENEMVPWVAGSALHEYGHYFNLGHKSCNLNIMNPSNATRTAYDGCQIREMYETLMTKNLRKYVVCEDVVDHLITVDNDEVWTNNMKVYNDIVIADGGSLTIRCELHFQPGTRIIVERGGELIVDGGLITSCGEWDGIIVEGFTGVPNNKTNGAGKVILKEEAIIENASLAISMNPVHLPWTDDFWGGYVEATNATIRNCGRAVAFMRHGQNGITDQSSFKNVTFDNIEDNAVTIWADDGIRFKDCQFRNCGISGILSHGSQMKVTSGGLPVTTQNFSDMPVGIELINPSISLHNGSDIVSNRFACDFIGVDVMTDDSSPPNFISNNSFNHGTAGIRVIGQSNFDINNNTFTDQSFPVVISNANGNGANPVDENRFTNSSRACITQGDNLFTEFTRNCFIGSSQVDIQNISGSIRVDQGGYGLEAGNCFTKSGIPEIQNTGTSINYFVYQEPMNFKACKETDLSSGVNQEEATQEHSAINCGSTLDIIDPDMVCDVRFDDPSEIVDLIENLDSNTKARRSETVSNNDLLRIESLKKILFHELGRNILGSSKRDDGYGKEFLLDYYSNRPEFYIRSLVPSIYITDGNYVAARQALNQIETSTIEEQEYKTVQHIYLNHLENELREVSASSIRQLHEIGVKSGPLNGYARSVYYLVTGDKLELDIPYFNPEQGEKKHVNVKRQINCFPNPTNSMLHIEIRESIDENYKLTLLDWSGKTIEKTQTQSNNVLPVDVSDLPSGLYILKISSLDNIPIHTEKVVILDQ